MCWVPLCYSCAFPNLVCIVSRFRPSLALLNDSNPSPLMIVPNAIDCSNRSLWFIFILTNEPQFETQNRRRKKLAIKRPAKLTAACITALRSNSTIDRCVRLLCVLFICVYCGCCALLQRMHKAAETEALPLSAWFFGCAFNFTYIISESFGRFGGLVFQFPLVCNRINNSNKINSGHDLIDLRTNWRESKVQMQ